MFYSVFVLGKKGPLARVWLAAHWDKKITKAQILETNIVESVDSILAPRVKLSLRTSSHLLLGIVRIYSRKTLYLLQDCQDAAFKIKSAFRPGAVDLPDGKTEAAISAITLPEMVDFAGDFDLIAEPPIQMDTPHTNANLRSITLPEDMSNVPIGDPMLEEARDWGDISSVHGGTSIENNLSMSTSHKNASKDANALDPFDRPIDDGFGDMVNDVDDLFAIPMPEGAQEQMQAEKEQREREEREAAGERPMSRMSERSDYSAPASMAPSGPPSTPGSVPPPADNDDDHHEQSDIFSKGPPGQNADGEIPFRRPSEAGAPDTLVLDPLEGSGHERGRRKRRKKLGILIDEVKTLSGEEMKSQLSDTSDIVAALDLAPPSKKLMHWKRTGGSEKLFAMPERPLPSKVLLNYYTRHLQTDRIEHEEEINFEEELVNGDAHHQDAHHQTRSQTRRMSERHPVDDDLNLEPIQPPQSPTKARKAHKTRKDASDKSPSKKRRRQDKENDGSQTPRPKTPRADIDRYSHLDENNFNLDESLPQLRDPSIVPNDSNRRTGFELPNFENEDDDYQDYEQPMSVGPQEEMMPDETAEQFEERVRNKRTNVLLRFIAPQLEEGEVYFSNLVRSNRRKQVAQKFYSLLVLKKQQTIELRQDRSVPYGEIFITAGSNYERALASVN